jgi:hypothetical protein
MSATEEINGGEVITPNESPKPRRKWLRRTLIISGIVLLLLLIILAVVIIWLGPIVESYVERNDKELIGRRVEMDNLSIRLFDGTASADNIILYEADSETTFASIERMEAEMAMGEIFDGHIHLTRVHLTRPYLSVVQNGDVFNFDEMIEFIFVKYILPDMLNESVEEEPEDEWKITIENVTIEDGYINYYDKEIDQRWELTAMNIHTDELILEDAMSNFDAELLINDAAPVKGTLLFNYDSFDCDFQGTLENFDIAQTYKYWTPYLNVTNVGGCGEMAAHIVGNVDNIMAMDIAGDFIIRDAKILGPDGGNILTAEEIKGNAERINVEYEIYKFNTLYATNYATQFILNADGTNNFSYLFPEDTEVSVETTAESLGGEIYDTREEVRVTSSDEDITSEMIITIGDLLLTNGSVYYADNTLHRPFEYNVSNLAIKGQNVDMDGYNSLTVEANVPKQGRAILRWDGSLNDFHNQSIMAILSNVDIQSFGPYVEYFTAFPVKSGNLTFRSQNTITNGNLNGVNQLGTYNFALGKKDKSMDVDFNLPLRAGVYILTDKDDHIDIELPVTGHIDSPEFSYRRAIWKAVGNLLLKVVATPFSWMSGDKQDAFRHINVKILDMGLSAEQYARIDKMAEVLAEDSTLEVHLTHNVNYKRAIQQIADLNLKIGYYNSLQSEDNKRLDMLDFSRINEMKLSNSDVLIFADSMLTMQGIDHSAMTTHAKSRALYGDIADQQLRQIMEHRNRAIRDYVSFQHPELRQGAIVIDEIDYEQIKSKGNKNRYEVTLVIDGEKIAVDSPDDEEDEEDMEDIIDEQNNI